MFWSLLKGMMILALSAVLAYGSVYLNSISGGVIIIVEEKEVRVSLVSATLLVVSFMMFFWFLIYCFGFLLAIISFFSGDETALSRYLNKSRENKGYKAILNTLIAVSEGDKSKALLQSSRASKYLKNNEIVTLVRAQVLEKIGDHSNAVKSYKKLLVKDATRVVALNGIIESKISLGEQDVALKIARKAGELNPKNLNLLNTLFSLQLEEKDWSGARLTLIKKHKLEKFPKEILIRREAVLFFAEAKEYRNLGKIEKALSCCLEAVRKSPGFVAALAFLTELENLSGNKKRIEKLLKKGWTSFPHPDIATSFASLEPEETISERFSRFENFIRDNNKSFEAILLKSELFILLEDFPAARREIKDLVYRDPDNRVLTVMAAIEKGCGETDNVVRGWLAKAASSQRSFEWICSVCGNQNKWEPLCKACNGFDTFEWKRPPKSLEGHNTSLMLPVLLSSNKDLESTKEKNVQKEFGGKEPAQSTTLIGRKVNKSDDKIATVKKTKSSQRKSDAADDTVVKNAREIL